MSDTSHTINRPSWSITWRWLVLGALLFAGLISKAQPVDPAVTLPDRHYSLLTESLELALKQSPQMLQRNIELAKADARRLMDDAIRLPSISGNGRYVVSTLSATNTKSSTSNGLLYNFGLTQPVFRWGDVRNTIEIDDLQVRLAQKNYAEGYRELVSVLRAGFLEMILKKRYLACIRFSSANVFRSHEANKEKMKSGQISGGQLAASEISLEEAQIEVQREELKYAQLKRTFARLSGQGEISDDRIPDVLPMPEFNSDQGIRLVQEFDHKDMARTTPSAEAKLYIIRQSELRYKIARTRLLPKVDFNAGMNQENSTNFSNQDLRQSVTNQKSVGLVANWSIFDGFATRGAKRLALEEKRDAEQQLALYLKTLDEQRQQQLSQLSLSARQLTLAERKLDMARSGLAYFEEEFKFGRRSEEQLNQDRGNQMLAEYGTMVARADLYSQWSNLVSLLWLDPVLQKLPASYLSHGK